MYPLLSLWGVQLAQKGAETDVNKQNKSLFRKTGTVGNFWIGSLACITLTPRPSTVIPLFISNVLRIGQGIRKL
jgi:hypothetical protein